MNTRIGGHAMKPECIEKIVRLLRETEMTVRDIGLRFSCSPSAVLSINRRYKVRSYCGKRSQWRVNHNTAA